MIFDTILHITNDLKTLYEKFNIVVKPQKYRHKHKNKWYLSNLGPVVAFPAQQGLNSWPFYTVLRLTVCSVLFSYIKGRQVTVCSLNSQISPASKNCTPIHHESTKSLRPGQSHISSPFWAACGFTFVLANMQFNRVVHMVLD